MRYPRHRNRPPRRRVSDEVARERVALVEVAELESLLELHDLVVVERDQQARLEVRPAVASAVVAVVASEELATRLAMMLVAPRVVADGIDVAALVAPTHTAVALPLARAWLAVHRTTVLAVGNSR